MAPDDYERQGDTEHLTLEFTGDVWEWRGPAPYFFVTVPEEESAYLHEMAPILTYGWGMVPVRVRIGETDWETSLWPKDGGYVLPLKDAVRRAEGIQEGAAVDVIMVPKGAS